MFEIGEEYYVPDEGENAGKPYCQKGNCGVVIV
jgi:hypothetical protein